MSLLTLNAGLAPPILKKAGARNAMKGTREMTSKLKALSLALMAALALSAVAASAASADELHSSSGSGTTFLTGTQVGTNQLDTEAGSVKCSTVGGSGSYAGTTITEEDVENVTYGGCTAFGLTAHIDMMGCFYRFKGINSTNATANIVCPTTAGGVTHEITITPTQGGVPLCHVEIPEQDVTLDITNTAGSPSDIDVEVTTASIKYNVTYIPADHTKTKCGTQGSHTDGKLTGSLTATAFSNASHTNAVN